MSQTRPLSIPVILGTTRQGRMSIHAAQFMTAEIQKRPGVITELIDIANLNLPVTDSAHDFIEDLQETPPN